LDYLMSVFAEIDIRKCGASKDNGKVMMFGKVTELKSGIHNANIRLLTTLKKTLLPFSTFAADARPEDFNLVSLGANSLTNNCQFANAETRCREANQELAKDEKGMARVLKAEWDKIPNSEKENHRSSISGDDKTQTCLLRLRSNHRSSRATQAKGDLDGADSMCRRSLIIRESA